MQTSSVLSTPLTLLLCLILTPLSILAQSTTSSTNSSSPACLLYSRTANLSTIGSNSTYRSAFLDASPRGNFPNAKMFSTAIVALPPMTIDLALNEECGNLTTVAATEAEVNYTKGVVLEFGDIDTSQVGSIFAGPELMPMIAFIMLAMAGVWTYA